MKSTLVAVLAAAMLIGASPARSDPLAPASVLELIRSVDPPARDLGELRGRIRSPQGDAGVQQLPPGHLWLLDFMSRSYTPVPVELRYSSEHADWYVERGRDARGLDRAAEFFEGTTLPLVSSITGLGWTPGANGQPKIAVFHGRISGVAGYMSSGDLQPRSVFPYSNERPTVYVNLDGDRVGTAAYNGTLAHELEHLAHTIANPKQQGWLDEGLAEFVGRQINGSGPPRLSRFAGRPDTQLNAWSAQPWDAHVHYEASHLWVRYLVERGGDDGLGRLIRSGGRGLETVDGFARALGLGSADDLFKEWLVANLVDAPDRLDGRYGYRELDHSASTTASLQHGQDPLDGRVHQFAADYFELPPSGAGELIVEAASSVPLIPAPDVRGAIFWGLRGDNVDTRLTREFDLSGLRRASLRFRLWHDLELGYDYCYVLTSGDGRTWQPMPGKFTGHSAEAGLSFGPAYNGRSAGGPGWVEEEIDLSPFSGTAVSIRFECTTDQNYSGSGLALDDIAIPELGFSDDGESDRGWVAEGFVRTPNAMAQPAAVLVVEHGPDTLTVRELPLDSNGRAAMSLGEPSAGVNRRVAVVAALAPVTLEEMPYRIWLR